MVALEYIRQDWSDDEKTDVATILDEAGIKIVEPSGGRGGFVPPTAELIVYVLGGLGSLGGIITASITIYDRIIRRKSSANIQLYVDRRRIYVVESGLGDEGQDALRQVEAQEEFEPGPDGLRYWRGGRWVPGPPPEGSD